MGSFITSAGKKAGDIRNFLKEAAGGNSIKYKAVAGAVHQLYFPFTMQQVEVDGQMVNQAQLVAISGNIHEWTDGDGHYKATICTKDVVRKSESGELLNDGSCPFCDRIQDGWDIYRYRMDLEEKTCAKVGKERETHLEAQKQAFLKERKAGEARPYIYILVAMYKTQTGAGGMMAPVLGKDGLPEFDLKVMKMSAKRVDDIQTQLINSGMDGLPGHEIVIDYPDLSDQRQVVGQSRVSPVMDTGTMVQRYPGLRDAINAAVAKFDMEQLDKSFQEWTGMTTAEAKRTMDELFANWDEYQAELKTNPAARYLEYGSAAVGPALGTPAAQFQAPAASGGIPAGVPQFQVPGAPVAGGQPVAGMPLPDANAMFGTPTVPEAPAAAPVAGQPGAPVGFPGAGVPPIPGGDAGVQI